MGLASACALLASAPALAAGGAHVVDDSEVETPGHCHLESWVTDGSGGSFLLNASPACTFRAFSTLEVGGFATRSRVYGTADEVAGLNPKLTLRPEASGLGIGLDGSVAIDLRGGRTSSLSIIAPVTLPLAKSVRVNVNGGWVWTRGVGHEAFDGAQVEVALPHDISFMAESFGRSRGRIGVQSGLRWTVANGHVDLDLLASRYGDGAVRHAATFGVTIRR